MKIRKNHKNPFLRYFAVCGFFRDLFGSDGKNLIFRENNDFTRPIICQKVHSYHSECIRTPKYDLDDFFFRPSFFTNFHPTRSVLLIFKQKPTKALYRPILPMHDLFRQSDGKTNFNTFPSSMHNFGHWNIGINSFSEKKTRCFLNIVLYSAFDAFGVADFQIYVPWVYCRGRNLLFSFGSAG